MITTLTHVIKEPTRVEALLDILANKEQLLGNVKAGGSLGCSENKMVGTGQKAGSQT